ncbi:inorganic triphosphatase [Paraglaciecola sp.]|uniref:CYTH domain-containing protein n=1 Tax=Paraglaciecola sp. TaxID=1920173 RepID=UPI003EFAB67F
MEYEIELKLLAAENAGDIIEQKFLPNLRCGVTRQKVELSNYYFDTQDRQLRINDIGLRIRGNGKNLEQTLKTAGQSIGALHQRPEFNVQLADKQQGVQVTPNLSLFDPKAWPTDFDVNTTQKNLSTLFATNFVRHIYLLDITPECQIEMVWDKGRISANGQHTTICEVELELKKGQPADLFTLAKQLLQVVYMPIGQDSKAARGYRLADNKPQKAPQLFLQDNAELITSDIFEHNVQQLLNCLQFSISQLQDTYNPNAVIQISEVLNRFELTVNQFLKNYDAPLLKDVLQRLKQLKIEWDQVESTITNEPEVTNKSSAIGKVLFRSSVTILQLDIVQILLEKKWSVNNNSLIPKSVK